MPSDAIAKVNYSHDAMIDLLIANPNIAQRDLAAHFQYTQGWVSQVMSSDAFKARLAARKGELVDPAITRSVEENLEGLARRSIGLLQEKMDVPQPPDVLLKVLDVSTRALGYGARGALVQVNQQFVALVPPQPAGPEDWQRTYAPRLPEAGALLAREAGALPAPNDEAEAA